MGDLAEFLLARIAEDEAGGRMAGQFARWHMARVLYVQTGQSPDWNKVPTAAQEEWAKAADRVLAETLVNEYWDPARVLAECEAKRRIVEAFVDAERAVATYDHAHPTDAYWQEWGNRHALALAVELLALPYADHPSYREEWKP